MSPRTPDPRKRWTADLTEQVAQAFRKGAVFTPFPILNVDGVEYQDLRGLPIREPVKNVAFQNVDLTLAYVEYNGHFVDNTASDCLFANATLDTNVSGTYRRCSFESAKLSGAKFYPWTTFSECTFARANVKDANGTAVTFDRCDFRSANLRGAQFTESEFYHCSWDDVRFGSTSLWKSKITRAGFPAERGGQPAGRKLPDVILDHAEWLDVPLASWPDEFEKLMAARAAQRTRQRQEKAIEEARAAFKEKRFDDAIARFSQASELGVLDEVSAKMLTLARKARAEV